MHDGHERPSGPDGLETESENGLSWPLVLGTWNVRGSARPDLVDIGAQIARYAPHIVVIQELRRHQALRLGEALSMMHTWSFKHAPFGPSLLRFGEGLSIFSIESPTKVETIDLTPHIRPSSYKRRIAQFAYFSSMDLDVVNIHLASHHDASSRFIQLETILRHVDRRGQHRCIVAGDFNATHEPELFARIANIGFADAWMVKESNEVQHNHGFTSPAGRVHQRIDRILTRGLDTQSATVPEDGPLWAKRSDHLPVFATFLAQSVEELQ